MADIVVVKRTGDKLWPEPGEAMITINADTGKEQLYMPCPRCNILTFIGGETGHTFTARDNLPTVTPSIGCSNCGFHAFLKHGQLEILRDMKRR